jgi:hypothetical protein
MALPLESVATDPRRFRRALVWLVFANVAIGVVLMMVSNEIATDAAPNGIFSLEFAGTAADAERIQDAWSPEQRTYAGFGLGLDYLYMVLYPLGLGLLCTKASLVARARPRPRNLLAALAATAGYVAILAALLDAVENAATLELLVSEPTDAWATMAVVAATAKFLLVAGVIVFLVVAAVVLAASRPRSAG